MFLGVSHALTHGGRPCTFNQMFWDPSGPPRTPIPSLTRFSVVTQACFLGPATLQPTHVPCRAGPGRQQSEFLGPYALRLPRATKFGK